MKKCCRDIKFLYPDAQKCLKCKHLYVDHYPEFTQQCECGAMPIKKAEGLTND